MALVDVAKGSFLSGELSPLMLARQDVERYKNGAILLENWQVLSQGGVTRRPGTRYVASAKFPNALCIIKPFEPSTTSAYILEIGHQYIRFYRNGARIESSFVPVEVVTPYLSTDLRGLRTAQSNDVMIFTHPSYAPRRLSRLSDTSWDFRVIPFYPPPTHEFGLTVPNTLTLGATTGSGVSVVASTNIFLPADVDRVVSSGIGRGILRTVTDATHATMDIVDAFSSTSVPANWTLERSPVADLKPSKSGPVGAKVTLTLQKKQDTASNMLTNGNFSSGDLTGWDNFSGATLATGTHSGAAGDELIDGSAEFLAAGVQPTMIVENVSDSSTGQAAVVFPHAIVFAEPGLVGGAGNNWQTGDTYNILNTGSATVSGGSVLLSAGTAGIGWISQDVTTVVGTTYRVSFNVSDSQVAAQVGSSGQGGEVKAENSYPLGEQAFTFTATGTTSYIQFRNNQPSTAKVGNIIMRPYSIVGWRTTDVGSYVKVNKGMVRITTYTSASQVEGEIVKELSSDDAAPAGAWSVEAPSWFDALGWPSAVVLYEGRLGFAGSARFPQTIWLSAIDDLFNFAVGENPDDALELSLVDSGGNITLNRIRWLMPSENLLVGNTHGEYRLVGSGDDPLTPATLPRNRIQSTFGSDEVQPLKVGASLLFTQRQGSKMREMSYDERTQTTYIARDMAITSSHLLKDYRIVELAYQQEPDSIVWAVRSDGQLLAITYDQSEQIVAWWRCTTEGRFESVATIPHPTANAYQSWVVVERIVGGFGIRMIEYFDPDATMALPEPVQMFNELTQETETITGWDGLTLDAAKVYTSLNKNTLDGLSYLAGHTIGIVADGALFTETVPTNGQIVLPHVVQTAFAGLPYTPRGRTMPVDVPIRGTTQQNLRKRWANLRARVVGTATLKLQNETLPFRQPHMPMDQGVAPFTGDRETGLVLGWDKYGFISFEAPDPLPCTIIGIFGAVDTEVRA